MFSDSPAAAFARTFATPAAHRSRSRPGRRCPSSRFRSFRAAFPFGWSASIFRSAVVGSRCSSSGPICGVVRRSARCSSGSSRSPLPGWPAPGGARHRAEGRRRPRSATTSRTGSGVFRAPDRGGRGGSRARVASVAPSPGPGRRREALMSGCACHRRRRRLFVDASPIAAPAPADRGTPRAADRTRSARHASRQ